MHSVSSVQLPYNSVVAFYSSLPHNGIGVSVLAPSSGEAEVREITAMIKGTMCVRERESMPRREEYYRLNNMTLPSNPFKHDQTKNTE